MTAGDRRHPPQAEIIALMIELRGITQAAREELEGVPRRARGVARRHRRVEGRVLQSSDADRKQLREEIKPLSEALNQARAFQVGGRQHHGGGRRAGRLQGPTARAGEVAGRWLAATRFVDHFRPFRDTSGAVAAALKTREAAGVDRPALPLAHQRQQPGEASLVPAAQRRQRPPARRMATVMVLATHAIMLPPGRFR